MNGFNRTVVAPLSSAIIAVLVAGLIVVGFDRVDRRLREGEARLETQGLVEVSVDGAPFVRASRNRVLGRHDRVRVVEGGAVLELASPSGAHEPRIELRGGSAVAVAGEGSGLVLEEGDLLVETFEETVRVDGGNAVVTVSGAVKLRRAASLAAGVYDGHAVMQKGAAVVEIPRYRQAAAAGSGLLPDVPSPLDLNPSDEWDRRMLSEVLVLDRQLDAFGREFEAHVPAASAADPGLYRGAVPGLADAPLTAERLRGRFPGENAIGLVLVALDTPGGDFDARWQRVFGFRSAGARWGLVAADRGLNPNPVLGHLELALGAVAPEAADGEQVTAGPGFRLRDRIGGIVKRIGDDEVAAPTQPPAPSGGGAGDQPGAGPGPASPPSSSPGSGGEPSPPPRKRVDLPSTGTAVDPLLDPLLEPLETLLSGVLDTLVGPQAPTTTTATPTPTSPAPTPTTTTTAPPGGLLGGLTSTVGGLTDTVGGLLGG